MKQENVISLYNALSAKVANVPTLDNEAYVRTYAILNAAKYASKEASVLGGAARTLYGGLQYARRMFNSTKRFNRDVFNAGRESIKFGKRVFGRTNPSLTGKQRFKRGLKYGALNFGIGLNKAIGKNPVGAYTTVVGLPALTVGAGSLAFGGGNDETPVKPTKPIEQIKQIKQTKPIKQIYDWQNDFIGSLSKWIKDNPWLAALAFGGLGLGVGTIMSK